MRPFATSEWAPVTLAVNGCPEAIEIVPFIIQPPTSRLASPSWFSQRRFGPNGSSRLKLPVKRCRTSKLDSPHSAARSLSFCATTPPPPPRLEASSLDLENVYAVSYTHLRAHETRHDL